MTLSDESDDSDECCRCLSHYRDVRLLLR
jgi:hypothetical protein